MIYIELLQCCFLNHILSAISNKSEKNDALFPTSENYPYYKSTQLHHITQSAIIALASLDTEYIHVSRLSNKHHKFLEHT